MKIYVPAAYMISRTCIKSKVERALDVQFMPLIKNQIKHQTMDRADLVRGMWSSNGFDAIQTVIDQLNGWTRWK